MDSRSIAIYGKHEPYNSWEDLTRPDTEGTLIATLAIADATDYVSIANLTEEYEYIGLHSTNGAVYLEEIDIVWNQTITGVESVDNDAEAASVYFDLQGRLVNDPAPGIYIRKNGLKTEKIVIR